ncbi:family 43 glycosylhydrolase [Pedococcus sp. 5OH_020]|uniref:family 43 glycosylhydrolase n=1 Tax=Pedococcus sp. 5OH_020 TaxID=2989814 RepID=UPI0022E9F453|nr:family 43 glycosylhydrolase [Pedococcus sp. 5OH_020]
MIAASRRLLTVALALVSLGGVGALPLAPPAQARVAPVRTTYVNPVSKPFADTFADPSVIRGKDGLWYAYGTSDPLREGERTPHKVPMARSTDLVHWTYAGDAFTAATVPSWAAPDASLWAPDIRYVDGQYRMYYVVTDTTLFPSKNDNAIGMATAPTPVGPWTDSGAPVEGPRMNGDPDNFLWTFDPSAVTDVDGSQWLFYGSYYGGLHVRRLTDDGRTAVGPSTMVAIDNKFEGAYVVRRGGYWYLFASTANCCAGPTTGYSVQVGRSRDLRGPYVDKQGVPLLQSRAGGTPVLNQNGNRWVGAGHNAIATDLAGRDWIVYHAIDRADPFLDEPYGINQRPMLLDRLDWVDGWPATRAGLGPSEGPRTGPDAAGATTTFTSTNRQWGTRGRWTPSSDPQSGSFLQSASPAKVVSRYAVPGDVRTEADLRSTGAAYGLVQERGKSSEILLRIDPATRTVTLSTGRRGAPEHSVSATLPASFDAADWHSVSLEVRDARIHAEVTHARLGDPLADLTLATPRPGTTAGHGGAYAAGPGVGVDNLSSRRAARLVTALAPTAVPSRLDPSDSDEFTGPGLRPGWQWVRQDDSATVAGGTLRWPTENADLTGDSNNAGVLLRDVGDGDWAAVTKLSIDLGTDTVRNYQQGGLIVYVDDDLFTRLSHVAIWNTRQTEFGKEMPYAGRLSYGGTIVGPPADTTWLRITHRRDPSNGEHELRAWTSTDGTTWVKGGVWTLPADAHLRVGLVSHGGVGATALFDWFRLYRG